jgi:uncharacterized protein (TIGR03067 family)
MRMFVLLAAIIALPDRPNPTPKEAPKGVHEQLLGDWDFVKLNFGNGADTPAKNETRMLRFGAKEIHVFVNGVMKAEDGADYTIDVTKSPIAFDLTPRNGLSKKVQGILKLEGDTLTLCFAIDDNRPVDFASDAKAQQAVMQLKRVKR